MSREKSDKDRSAHSGSGAGVLSGFLVGYVCPVVYSYDSGWKLQLIWDDDDGRDRPGASQVMIVQIRHPLSHMSIVNVTCVAREVTQMQSPGARRKVFQIALRDQGPC